MSGTRFQPHALDKDDEGDDAANSGNDSPVQDDAYVNALRKAIRRNKENATEGFKKDTDARVVRSLRRPATYVPSMSALLNV